MNNLSSQLKLVRSPWVLLALTVVAVPTFLGFVFFATAGEDPHVAELAFVEHSTDTSLIGSVVPASCESAPPMNHFAGDCAVPPTPAGISAPCPAVPVNPPGAINISYPATPRASSYAVRVDYAGDPAPHLVQSDIAATSFQFTPTLGVAYSAWVHACNLSGCSAPVYASFNCPFPVVVDLNASPTKVDAGGAVTLTWTVSGATTCTASGGAGWTGPKSASSGIATVYPTANTSYTLTCNGAGGTVPDTTSVQVPSGYISATSCTIPIDGTSCPVNVFWESYNFFSTSNITQNGTSFSSTASNPSPGVSRSVNPDNFRFVLRDTGGSFSDTHDVVVNCATGSVWAGGSCIRLPDVDIETDPEVIRSGSTADLTMEINAAYELTCTLSDGGAPYVFTHPGALTPLTYNRTTRPLTSAQVVDITCVSPLYPVVNGDSQVRINVVPTIQEI